MTEPLLKKISDDNHGRYDPGYSQIPFRQIASFTSDFIQQKIKFNDIILVIVITDWRLRK